MEGSIQTCEGLGPLLGCYSGCVHMHANTHTHVNANRIYKCVKGQIRELDTSTWAHQNNDGWNIQEVGATEASTPT